MLKQNKTKQLKVITLLAYQIGLELYFLAIVKTSTQVLISFIIIVIQNYPSRVFFIEDINLHFLAYCL